MSWDCPRAMPNPTGAGSTVSRCLCCWRDVYVEGECFGIRVELAGIALEREGDGIQAGPLGSRAGL